MQPKCGMILVQQLQQQRAAITAQRLQQRMRPCCEAPARSLQPMLLRRQQQCLVTPPLQPHMLQQLPRIVKQGLVSAVLHHRALRAQCQCQQLREMQEMQHGEVLQSSPATP